MSMWKVMATETGNSALITDMTGKEICFVGIGSDAFDRAEIIAKEHNSIQQLEQQNKEMLEMLKSFAHPSNNGMALKILLNEAREFLAKIESQKEGG